MANVDSWVVLRHMPPDTEFPMRGLLLAYLTSGLTGLPAGAGLRMSGATKTTAKTKTVQTV